MYRDRSFILLPLRQSRCGWRVASPTWENRQQIIKRMSDHHLVKRDDAKHCSLPHTWLHVVIGLQQTRVILLNIISFPTEPNLTHLEQSWHQLRQMGLNRIGSLTLHKFRQHLDGGLVDWEVPCFDNGVQHPDHHFSGEDASHGGGTSFRSPHHVLLLVLVRLEHLHAQGYLVPYCQMWVNSPWGWRAQ